MEIKTDVKIQRNAGVELLRIFAALSVVFGHFINVSGLRPFEMYGGGIIINGLRIFTYPAVDVFVIISGYFLCLNNKRTLGKLSTLIFQTAFVYAFLFLAKFIMSLYNVELNAVVPVKWFIPLYITLYCISPFINAALTSLNKKQLTYMIIALLFFFSVLPVVDCITTSAGYNLGLSTVATNGSNAGYSILNFVVVYCVGAYIRISELHKKLSSWIVFIVILLCFIAIRLLSLIPYSMTPFNVAGWYDSIFVIILAASYLILSLKINMGGKVSKVIVNLAKANFICYLLHYALLRFANPHDVLVLPTYKALPIMILFCFAIYLLSWMLWLFYNLVFNWLVKKLDRFVFYSDEIK